MAITLPQFSLSDGTNFLLIDPAGSLGYTTFADIKAAAGGTPSVTTTATTSPTGALDLIIDSVTFSPAAPVAGQAIQARAAIRNAGGTAAPSGTILGIAWRYPANANPPLTYNDVYTAGLAPGATITLTGLATFSLAAGSYPIQAWVDDVDRFGALEPNKANNFLTLTLAVASATVSATVTTTVTPSTPSSLIPPQGFYEAGVGPGTSAEINRISDMAARGATQIISYWAYPDGVYSEQSDTAITTFLDTCAAKGMKAIISFSDPNWYNGNIPASTRTAKVNLVKGHSALLGYNVCDEASGSTAVSQIKAHAAAIRSLDSNPAHLIFSVHYPGQFPAAWNFYSNSAINVVGIDDYPYGEYSTTATAQSQMSQYQGLFQGAKDRGKKLWFVAQANNVPVSYPDTAPNWPYPQLPTVSQMKFQRDKVISVAAAVGVELVAIYWYSYFDNARDYPAHLADVETVIKSSFP